MEIHSIASFTSGSSSTAAANLLRDTMAALAICIFHVSCCSSALWPVSASSPQKKTNETCREHTNAFSCAQRALHRTTKYSATLPPKRANVTRRSAGHDVWKHTITQQQTQEPALTACVYASKRHRDIVQRQRDATYAAQSILPQPTLVGNRVQDTALPWQRCVASNCKRLSTSTSNALCASPHASSSLLPRPDKKEDTQLIRKHMPTYLYLQRWKPARVNCRLPYLNRCVDSRLLHNQCQRRLAREVRAHSAHVNGNTLRTPVSL